MEVKDAVRWLVQARQDLLQAGAQLVFLDVTRAMPGGHIGITAGCHGMGAIQIDDLTFRV